MIEVDMRPTVSRSEGPCAIGVSADWYARQYAVPSSWGPHACLSDYLSYGVIEGRRIAEWFDEDSYLRRYADVSEAIRKNELSCAFEHYLRFGLAEGRVPRDADWSLAIDLRGFEVAAGWSTIASDTSAVWLFALTLADMYRDVQFLVVSSRSEDALCNCKPPHNLKLVSAVPPSSSLRELFRQHRVRVYLSDQGSGHALAPSTVNVAVSVHCESADGISAPDGFDAALTIDARGTWMDGTGLQTSDRVMARPDPITPPRTDFSGRGPRYWVVFPGPHDLTAVSEAARTCGDPKPDVFVYGLRDKEVRAAKKGGGSGKWCGLRPFGPFQYSSFLRDADRVVFLGEPKDCPQPMISYALQCSERVYQVTRGTMEALSDAAAQSDFVATPPPGGYPQLERFGSWIGLARSLTGMRTTVYGSCGVRFANRYQSGLGLLTLKVQKHDRQHLLCRGYGFATNMLPLPDSDLVRIQVAIPARASHLELSLYRDGEPAAATPDESPTLSVERVAVIEGLDAQDSLPHLGVCRLSSSMLSIDGHREADEASAFDAHWKVLAEQRQAAVDAIPDLAKRTFAGLLKRRRSISRMTPKALHLVKKDFFSEKAFFHGSVKDQYGRVEYFEDRGIDVERVSFSANGNKQHAKVEELLRSGAINEYNFVLIEYLRLPSLIRQLRKVFLPNQIILRSHNPEVPHRIETARDAWLVRNTNEINKIKMRTIGRYWVDVARYAYLDAMCSSAGGQILTIGTGERDAYWKWLGCREKVAEVPYFLSKRHLERIVLPPEDAARKRLCVCVGSFHSGPIAIRQVDTFLDLAGRTRPHVPLWDFIVTGDAEPFVRTPPVNVRFSGNVPDPYELLRDASAVAIPTVSGLGFKTKVLEAILHRCFVVAPKGFADRVPPEIRMYVIEYEFNDPADFARALEASLNPWPGGNPNDDLRTRAFRALDLAVAHALEAESRH